MGSFSTHPMPGRCHRWSLIPTKRRYCRGFGVQVGRLSLLGKKTRNMSGWCGEGGVDFGGYYTLWKKQHGWFVAGLFGLVSFGGRKIWAVYFSLLKPCPCGFFDLAMLEFAWTMHIIRLSSQERTDFSCFSHCFSLNQLTSSFFSTFFWWNKHHFSAKQAIHLD